MLVLGIETSCDETAASIVRDSRVVLSNVIATQVPVHARYGGIVPELASRNHLMSILPVIERALREAGARIEDVDGIAVTQGPGLMGSLLVGTQTAKTLALIHQRPVVGVDHIAAHITAIGLEPPPGDHTVPMDPPFVALVASGGHTALYHVSAPETFEVLGHTLDDAAGEAFDKVAKLVGLGYPGGAAMDRLAESGERASIPFPRALLGRDSLDFSFSGLKTAVRSYVEDTYPAGIPEEALPTIAANVREAIVDVLVEKALRAVARVRCPRLVIAGGVAANRRLREVTREKCALRGVELGLTPLPYCTDNAAMVARLGACRLESIPSAYSRDDLALEPYPNLAWGTPRSLRNKSKYASHREHALR